MSPTAPPAGNRQEVSLAPREEPYLISRSSGPLPQGVDPVSLETVEQAVQTDPSIRWQRTLRPMGLVALSDEPGKGDPIIVAEMPADRASALEARHPQLIVERDLPVDYTQPAPAPPGL